MNNWLRKIGCILLLIAGVTLWGEVLGFSGVSRLQAALLVCALLVCLLPPVSRKFAVFLDRLRHPSPRMRGILTLMLWVLATGYLISTALEQHRPTYPRSHDEQAYLLQMRFLSSGKLWTNPPPMGNFFETFYVLVKPVYASIYFPGTALLYVWEIWLKTPHWVGPAMVAGLCVALTFRVVAELLDDAVLGFLAALYLLGIAWFRYLSILVFSHLVIIMFGLLLVWAYLHWRERRHVGWALVIGIIVGWSAITRPLDAFCYGVPVAIAMLARVVKMDGKKAALTVSLVIAGAAPFAALQGLFNHAVTASFTHSPYDYYVHLYYPGMEFGSGQLDLTKLPQTNLLQKKVLYDTFIVPALKRAQEHRFGGWFAWKLKELLIGVTPTRVLVVLLPVGLMTAFRRERWVLAGMLVFFFIGYGYFPFMLGQYEPIAAPAVALLVMAGYQEIVRSFAEAKHYLKSAGTIVLLVLCVMDLHEFSGKSDDKIENDVQRMVALEMPKYVKAPAVVLFTFDPVADNAHEDPVYNIDSVNPDDSPVIRANDLGQRDREIFEYYARKQPERNFYQFRRSEGIIVPMGTARELARKYPVTQPSR